MHFGRLMRKPMEDYKGLHVGCTPGTHAALVDMIGRHLRPCNGVLDIGACAGALLLRLRDKGFGDLTGTDLDTTRFNLPDATFLKLELNQRFSEEFTTKFKLITCTDVIEHLDSPRNFLAEACALLEEGGYLALSLPNVAFWEGRCKFLLKGELWGFGEKNYRLQRHISPITFDQMRMMTQEIGFEVVEVGTGGSFATPFRQAVTFPIWGPLRWIAGFSVLGEAALFLLKKSEPNPELKVPIHYKNRWRGIPDMIGLEDLSLRRERS
jgi:2-polyprenyl-3-methyl-5-hydroxy-6-metoxy-1,4-benzoquinol methylase